jgi:hypothetical protein
MGYVTNITSRIIWFLLSVKYHAASGTYGHKTVPGRFGELGSIATAWFGSMVKVWTSLVLIG